MRRQLKSLETFARAAKVAALLFFLLPWVAVSCSSVPGDNAASQVVTVSDSDGSGTATGFGLATGTAKITVRSATKALPSPPGPRPAVLAAILLILLSLAATFARRGRIAAVAGSAAAVGLLGYTIFFEIRWLTRDWLLAWAGSEFPAQPWLRDPREMMEAIQVRPQIGFWLTIAALLVAIVLDALALKRAPSPAAP
jgi:hypothetical protein